MIPVGPYLLDSEDTDVSTMHPATHVESSRRVWIRFVPHALTTHPRDTFELGRGIAAASALNHPGILRILDHGVTSVSLQGLVAGTHYLVYENHDAGDLVSVPGTRTWARSKAILLSILDVLAYAHSFGLVHGHLDPTKVVFQQIPEGVMAKIEGFGLGEILPSAPVFAAPERIAHPDFTLTPRHDLFSLGRIYEELLRTNLNEEGKHRWAGELPKELNSWLAKLIALNPDHRFESASAAARDLATMDAPQHHGAITFLPTLADEVSVMSIAPTQPSFPALNPHLEGLRELAPIGRNHILRLIDDTMAEVKKEATTRLVWLSAEPGMEVERLVTHVKRRLRQRYGAQQFVVRNDLGNACDSGLEDAVRLELRPYGTALETVVIRLGRVGLMPPSFERALVSMCTDPADEVSLIPFRLTLPDQRRLAIIEWLRVRSQTAPQILVVHGVHRSKDSVRLIQKLCAINPALPLLIIATSIQGEESCDDLAQVFGDLDSSVGLKTVEVSQVDPEAALKSLEGLRLSADQAQAVVQAAQGKPSLLHEYAYEIACGCPVPASQTAMYEERLRLLSLENPDADTALEIAAALGRSVILTEWEMACGLARISFNLNLVQTLVERRFVEHTAVGWRFKTACLHDLLRRRSSESDTWKAHKDLARRVLEVRYDAEQTVVAARTARYAIDAETLSIATQATLRSIQGLVAAGRGHCARELVIDCLALRRQQQQVECEGTVRLWLAHGQALAGQDSQAAIWWLERGLNRAHREGWDALWVLAAAALAQEMRRCSDSRFLDYAQQAAVRVLSLESGLDVESELLLIDSLLHGASVEFADRLLNRIETAVAAGPMDCVYKTMRCRSAIHHRKWPLAQEYAAMAAVEAEQRGDFETFASALVMQARCEFQKGQHDLAYGYFLRANELQQRIGASLSVSSFGLGVLAAGRGDLSVAVRRFREACDPNSLEDVEQTRIMRDVGLLWVAVLRGDLETTRLELQKLKRDFVQTDVNSLDIALILKNAAIPLLQQSPADARDVLELAARIYEASGDSGRAYMARSSASKHSRL